MSTLKDDRLPTIEAIAEYTGDNVRRVRHLIAAHDFPAKKIGGRLQASKTEVDRYYNGGERSKTTHNGR